MAWVKGQSGNPSGAPKRKRRMITEAFEDAFEMHGEKGKRAIDRIVNLVRAKAEQGDIDYINMGLRYIQAPPAPTPDEDTPQAQFGFVFGEKQLLDFIVANKELVRRILDESGGDLHSAGADT